MGWDVNPALGSVFGAIPLAAGRFYDSGLQSAYTTLAMAVNTLYAAPFYVPRTTTFTSINIEVTVLALASSMRLGIYTDTSGAPDALVLDAGTVSLTTTGGKTIAISQSLAAGWYWLAGVGNGLATLRAASQTNAMGNQIGFSSGTDTTNHVGWSVAFAFGALPNPFQAGGAVMAGACPRFMLGI